VSRGLPVQLILNPHLSIANGYRQCSQASPGRACHSQPVFRIKEAVMAWTRQPGIRLIEMNRAIQMGTVLVECDKFIRRKTKQNARIVLGWIPEELGTSRRYFLDCGDRDGI